MVADICQPTQLFFKESKMVLEGQEGYYVDAGD
jgi:hypothetical protein